MTKGLAREGYQGIGRGVKSDPGPTTARRKGATPKERAIQKAILDYLGTVPGVYAFKSGAGLFPMAYKGKARMVRMGRPGVSDIVGWQKSFVGNGWGDGVVSARFLAIEVKKPGRYPTPEQQAFLDSVRDAGGISICARSVDDVRKGLGL